eukprot:CAMPEP_0197529388 /NCGR_PEP_ID=MMETSP1318-20131121/28278_1 /TAXON_ID=552666 /ORGANISM="Partenskyella glossopodia, Strain RCC365" /LENGTH=141 /DNA_ID=CAMNT_0043084831 /DNA_START=402 /DNA_END=827 /DNA_ORIENTATION=+
MSGGFYKMWTADTWKEFEGKRLSRWIEILNTSLLRNHSSPNATSGGSTEKKEMFFFGDKVSYADFAVLAILEGLIDEFGLSNLLQKHAALSTFYKQMSSRESVRKIWALQKPSNRSKWWPYAGGQIQASIEKSIAQLRAAE